MTANPSASILGDVAGAVWHASWQATVLIGLVLLTQWTFGRQLTPRARACLWLLVLARLAWPAFPTSPTSIFNLPALLTREHAVQTVSANRSPAGALPVATARQSQMAGPNVDPLSDAPQPAASVPIARAGALLRDPPPASAWKVTHILSLLWFSGALILLIRTTAAGVRLARHVRRLPPVTQPAALCLFETCRRQARVRRRLRFLVAEPGFPPAVGGLFRPYLLIPADLLSREDSPALRFILLHELAHLRTGDLLVNWISLALRAVHWFNPAIWFAFARMSADRELACDAYVLSQTETTEHESYGHLLIDVIERLNGRRPSPVTVGMSAPPALLQTRIRFIRRYNRPRVWQSLLAIAVASILGLCGLTSAQTVPGKEQAAKNPAAQKSTEPSESVTSAAHQAKGSNPSHTITLNVACVAEDGSPVAGAEVVVYAIDPWTLEAKPAMKKATSSDGTCRFNHAPATDGTICRVLRGPGNQVCAVAAKSGGRASALRQITTENVAQSAATVALVMPRTESLAGRVTGPQGKPVPGAWIYRLTLGWQMPVPRLGCAKTDDGGSYELTDIAQWSPPGDAGQTRWSEYRKDPRGTIIKMSSTVPEDFNLHAYHPDYGRIRVPCRRVPGLTNIRFEEAGILTGRVVDATSKQPLAGVSVFVEAQPTWKTYSSNWGMTDANGAYRIAVTAGNDYHLFFYKEGFDRTTKSPRPSAIPAKLATSVEDLEMVRVGTIRGRLIDRGTKNPVRLLTNSEVRFVVRSAQEKPWATEPFTTLVGKDGQFEQPAVHPGRAYSLSLESTDPAIKSQSNIIEVSVTPGKNVEVELPVIVTGSNRSAGRP